jgi:hypothetical protein
MQQIVIGKVRRFKVLKDMWMQAGRDIGIKEKYEPLGRNGDEGV